MGMENVESVHEQKIGDYYLLFCFILNLDYL